MEAHIERLVRFFEQLTPDDVQRLAEFYRRDARFKDPFNDVQGLDAIAAVYAHMFVALDAPRFVVRDVVAQGELCFISWDFLFRFKRGPHAEQTIHGATRLRLDAAGLIAEHRDYWDAAEEVYEKLPVLGVLMRWLKRRATAPAAPHR